MSEYLRPVQKVIWLKHWMQKEDGFTIPRFTLSELISRVFICRKCSKIIIGIPGVYIDYGDNLFVGQNIAQKTSKVSIKLLIAIPWSFTVSNTQFYESKISYTGRRGQKNSSYLVEPTNFEKRDFGEAVFIVSYI